MTADRVIFKLALIFPTCQGYSKGTTAKALILLKLRESKRTLVIICSSRNLYQNHGQFADCWVTERPNSATLHGTSDHPLCTNSAQVDRFKEKPTCFVH